ncbi:DUF2752 domain-containing protein [Anaerocolumna sp. MB42-C2]|uniref:DUF2752 domain-containing protein n=1 Tax=Anaerocolumna sp. MB42-C2 TaxID=3070997 RepID=UPI0027DF61FB|nr:DUF2752 domain-containing protein [Anaerocolumna sp. MB42-C2]WMJ89044.1 DUF2752 domain-containing protein [Anaerocolumna sp. MB42-C2]
MNELLELIKKYWLGVVLCIIAMIILNSIFGTVCLSKIFIGIPCPACGITRATKLLLTGHFRESFQMHPLLLLIAFEVIICKIIKNLLKKCRFFINFNVIICMVIFVSFYIYRMKVYYPNVEPLVYWKDNYLHKAVKLYWEYKLHE